MRIYAAESPLVDRLARHLAEFDQQLIQARTWAGGDELPEYPSTAELAQILNTVFWASLQQEEGRYSQLSVEYWGAGRSRSAMSLAGEVPFEPEELAKVAPALDGTSLVLSTGLRVTALSLRSSSMPVRVDAVRPGRLIVRHRDDNLAVLGGGHEQFLGRSSVQLGQLIARGLRPQLTPEERSQRAAILVSLVHSMRLHERGGALLVVPPDHSPEPCSLSGHRYQIASNASCLWEISRELQRARAEQEETSGQLLSLYPFKAGRVQGLREQLARVARSVARFSAVDGVLMLTQDLTVLGFGGKIECSVRPDRLQCTVAGSTERTTIELEALGGTRHQSAARFVHAHPDTLAFVCSQDGHVTMLLTENGALLAVRNLEYYLL